MDVFFDRGHDLVRIRLCRHLFRLEVTAIPDARTVPAKLFQQFDDLAGFLFR